MTLALADALRDAIAAAGWHDDPAGDPVSEVAYLDLLRPLYAAGRRDLPLGRLLEGHVDAVQIVRRYGTASQVASLRGDIAAGAMLGVWNAALPDAPLTLDENDILRGGKGFASGAGILSHALVTADSRDGPRLLLVDLTRTPPEIDRSWWHMTGMQRSETHRVRWPDVAVSPDDRIGAAGDYAREPFFSGGALRFVAVQAGGIAALFDRTRDHLVTLGRDTDPFQAARLAALFQLADGAASAVRRAVSIWFGGDGETRLAQIAATRLAVVDAAGRAILLAQEAVGVQGLFLEHPLSATLSDLAVYLRQPAPDAQRLRVGRAVSAGLLSPSL